MALLMWVGMSILLIVNTRKISYLKSITAQSDIEPPSVAVIIAVKDEEQEVEEALRSVCELQYPRFSIIVINDRSTDQTAAILHRMAQQNPQLRIITIKQLPQGWLGKNHALYQGYCAATEDWLLFTDADVKFDAGTLQKALNYIQQKDLDHLTVLPEVTSKSSLFRAVMNTFALMLDVKLKPWTISDPHSDTSMGVGAFNLVSRQAYEKAGTHVVISLRPDDDLKLGERIKRTGSRQDIVYGEGQVSLDWYQNLGQFVQGLMKNMFSVYNYQPGTAIATAILTFCLLTLPVPLLLFSGAPFYWMGLTILVAQIAIMAAKKGIKAKWWHALLIPFSGLVMVYIILKSTQLTIRQGGIYWRDSFYPLSELRKQI
ncbi:MAG: hypothetical protein JWP88_1001 [Flaviaesturariibacter sp.]|nr:hypothetical protein [Flaviaesturariibacter sp.]